MIEKLITLSELSKSLCRSKVTIWRWVNDGTLPKPIKINGNILGWENKDIQDWIENNK